VRNAQRRRADPHNDYVACLSPPLRPLYSPSSPATPASSSSSPAQTPTTITVSDWVQDCTDHIQGADDATITVPVTTHPSLWGS